MTAVLTHLAAVALGIILGGSYSIRQINKREALRRDLAAELRSPVDLEPCEFSHDWSVR